jgi:hypothetical protein
MCRACRDQSSHPCPGFLPQPLRMDPTVTPARLPCRQSSIASQVVPSFQQCSAISVKHLHRHTRTLLHHRLKGHQFIVR